MKNLPPFPPFDGCQPTRPPGILHVALHFLLLSSTRCAKSKRGVLIMFKRTTTPTRTRIDSPTSGWP